MYLISSELYREVARRFCDVIGEEKFFSGSIEFEFGDAECRLTTTVMVYHTICSAPDGNTRQISDLIPIWWEFHTTTLDGERLNDFSFSELKSYI